MRDRLIDNFGHGFCRLRDFRISVFDPGAAQKTAPAIADEMIIKPKIVTIRPARAGSAVTPVLTAGARMSRPRRPKSALG